MSTQELFEGFDEATQARYEEEAARLWGEKHVKESRRRWNRYTAEEKSRIFAEANEIYRELAKNVAQDPAKKEVQALLARWHENLRNFYEPTREILLGLGQAYSQHPEFAAFFRKIHPDLPAFLTRAIGLYCESMAGAS
jgi:hypothetical protein